MSRSSFIENYLAISNLHLTPVDWQNLQKSNLVKVVGDNTELYVILPTDDSYVYERLIRENFSFSLCYLMKSASNHKIKGLHISAGNELDPKYTHFTDDWAAFSERLTVDELPATQFDDEMH
jgi:hypothetical protein